MMISNSIIIMRRADDRKKEDEVLLLAEAGLETRGLVCASTTFLGIDPKK